MAQRQTRKNPIQPVFKNLDIEDRRIKNGGRKSQTRLKLNFEPLFKPGGQYQ